MPKKPTARKDHNKVPRAPRELSPAEPREAERIAKVIARVGLGSRREVEEWILAGRVAVNGEVLDTPARTVTPEDRIEVDGTPLPAKERTRLFLYHKPKGVVTTNYDPEGRPTLFEILPGGLPRLVSVGRLDLNTEGLILLTNDGGLSRVLELPETGWLRRYRVRAKGEITQDKLDALIKGVTVDGVHYGPIEAVLDRVQGANVWLTLALREGKNREVRNVLGSLGLDVNRLIRLSYGPFQLGEIAQGAVEEVRTRVLSDQLGPELSAAAGADFEGPLFVHDEVEQEAARPAKGKASGPAKSARYAKPEGGEDRHRRRPIDVEESAERSVTSGLVADRKGRKVLVQRVRSTETVSEEDRPARPLRERELQEAEREAKRAHPMREPKAPGRTPGGERTFRKRPDEERGAGRRERPEGDRPFRSRDDSRPEGRRPFRSDDSRPPRRERPEGERAERPFRERAPRPEGERSERPFRNRSEGERGFRPREEGDRPARRERPEGDRPFRERASHPEGERGERPFRSRSEGAERRFEGDRPPRRERLEGDRPPRRERPEGERGERPFRSRSEGAERRFEGDRPPRRERPEGDRPFRARAPRPEGGRSFRGEATDRPYSGRVKSEGSFRERGPGRGFGKPGGRPTRDAEDGEPRGERRPARSFGDRPFSDKPARGKPGASRPEGERSGGKPGGRPFGGKPGGHPSGGKPSGGRPSGGKPGGKPFGGKPGGRPSGGKPGRPPRG